MLETQKAESVGESLYHWHTVLIVDDDLETLAALRRLLAREPYDVITMDRPSLALDWIKTRAVSLVISDQRMPEMVGELFLESVWTRSPGTLRLLLTGYPETVGQAPGARRRPLKVIAKPWNDTILKHTIRSMLRKREGSME
jgi:response regulator RpfG family c-di-GMP phosphodiesterase